MEGKYHCYFVNFSYFSQEGFNTYQEAKAFGRQKGWEHVVYIRTNNQWEIVQP